MADQIKFNCKECGSSKFVFPNDPPEPDDMISCAGCGKVFGRYADVQAAVRDHGKAEMEKAVSKAFGKKIKLDWRKK